MAISFTSRVSAPSDVLISQVGGESVILNTNSEQYFGLDEVGTSMWQALTSADSIQDAFERLLTEYEVEPGRLRKDLSVLVEKLVENGLLEVSSE